MSGKRVVTFGEIMLRLAPEGYLRFIQADRFGATFGGGEANVALSLSVFGMLTSHVTALPDNPIGQAAINTLRRYGVDTGHIRRSGKRIGIYYLEKGASQRPSSVVYDRAGSSLAETRCGDFDWQEIFKDAGWFHFTGITPALGDNLAELCLEACKAAKAAGCTVSCDPNYRSSLWSKEKASEVLGRLMEYVDVCITNVGQAYDVFGIKPTGSNTYCDILNEEEYLRIAEELKAKYNFKKVAVTMRESLSASDNNWTAMLYDGTECHYSRTYQIHIVERVGGGDSFAAGLIYSLINGRSDKDAIEFAAAASCLKHTVEGDYNLVTVSEVDALAYGDGAARVQR